MSGLWKTARRAYPGLQMVIFETATEPDLSVFARLGPPPDEAQVREPPQAIHTAPDRSGACNPGGRGPAQTVRGGLDRIVRAGHAPFVDHAYPGPDYPDRHMVFEVQAPRGSAMDIARALARFDELATAAWAAGAPKLVPARFRDPLRYCAAGTAKVCVMFGRGSAQAVSADAARWAWAAVMHSRAEVRSEKRNGKRLLYRAVPDLFAAGWALADSLDGQQDKPASTGGKAGKGRRTSKPKSKGGRPQLPRAERDKRTRIYDLWQDAKGRGEALKDFASETGVMPEYVSTVVKWMGQWKKRSTTNSRAPQT